MAKPKTEIKDTLKEGYFLPHDNRAKLIEEVAKLGFGDGDSLNDDELLAKLQELASNIQSQAVGALAVSEEKKLEAYREGSYLNDMDFVMRLYHAGVPKIYLKIFKDMDAALIIPKKDKDGNIEGYNMKAIWKMVRESGINPQTISEIFRPTHLNEAKIERIHSARN